MNILAITGGLGNQMFQYALCIALEKSGHKIKLDTSKYTYYNIHNNYELEKVFQINASYATYEEIKKFGYLRDNRFTRLLLKTPLAKKSIYIENENSSFEVLDGLEGCYLKGFWQNENFFLSAVQEVNKIFAFYAIQDKKAMIIAQQIKESERSVSFHVRRGDYLNHPLYKNICNKRYYEQAYLLIKEEIGDEPECFIFSNDIAWAQCNISFPRMHIVDVNAKESSYIDMQLMSMCKYNVIANSSFSWWGAWLNKNKKKVVVAPSQWTNEENGNSRRVIPESWLTI